MKTPSPAILEALYAALDYDPATGEIRWRQNRRRVTEGDLAGSISRDGTLVVGFNGTSYQAHHVAWYIETGDWPDRPVLFADKDPMNLVFTNLYLQEYVGGSKANYMRQWRGKQRAKKRQTADLHRNQSDLPNVQYSAISRAWNVRSAVNASVVLASFDNKAAAESYAAMTTAGRAFIYANPPELFPSDPERNNRTTGGPGALTYESAATRFAYDPLTGAIYRRTDDRRRIDQGGTPAIEIDDTRRPIIRASGRTYSAGMLAWFIHTGGEWPKRKQLGYRDGNRKNTAWSNLYLKGDTE